MAQSISNLSLRLGMLGSLVFCQAARGHEAVIALGALVSTFVGMHVSDVQLEVATRARLVRAVTPATWVADLVGGWVRKVRRLGHVLVVDVRAKLVV